MSIKRYLLPTITILVILGLLYAAAWQHDHPRWHSMPESLTKPDPNIDRSRIPLGPYTVNVEGLIAGWSKNSVTFYVVVRQKKVSFQLTGEVGSKLDHVLSVAPMSVSFSAVNTVAPQKVLDKNASLIDGLRPYDNFNIRNQRFDIPKTHDAYGNPIIVFCFLDKQSFTKLIVQQSFNGIVQGSCRAYFRPRKHLNAVFTYIPSSRFQDMALFLPRLYSKTSELIQGEP